LSRLAACWEAAEVHRALDDAIALMMKDELANHASLVEAHRLRGEAYLAEQHLVEAEAEVNEALRRLGYPQKMRGPRLPNAVLSLARVQRAQNKPQAAAETAQVAVRLFEADAIDPAQSADVGEGMLELARAQLALGDRAAARKSLVSAAQSLRNSLGAEHELTKQAEAQVGELSLLQ
jgi:TolA-binding protein